MMMRIRAKYLFVIPVALVLIAALAMYVSSGDADIHAERLSYPYPLSPVPNLQEFDKIHEMANSGDTESQLYMGHFYANGNVVSQDFTKAVGWYKKAAARGNARAQYYLGVMHDFGIGVSIDYKTAFQSYMAAVDQDDVAAHLGIAGFHFVFRRSYMPPDFGTYDAWRAKAIILSEIKTSKPSFEEQIWLAYTKGTSYWLNNSEVVKVVLQRAELGDANAILDLARLITHGQGVSRDAEYVNTLIKIAANSGSHHAMFILGALSEFNNLIKINPFLKKQLRNAAESREELYFSSYYHYRCLVDLFKVSDRERISKSSEIDKKMRPHFRALEENAEKGNVYAQFRLGYYLRFFKGHDKKAYEMFERAANKGDHRAAVFQGIMQLYGAGAEQNISSGKARLDKAILYPAEYVLYSLEDAIRHFHRLYPEKTSTILSYFHDLDALNDVNAAFYIGEFYSKLSELNHNPFPWYLRADTLGCPPASRQAIGEITTRRIIFNEKMFNEFHYPGASLIQHNRRYFQLAFPSADNGYALSIAFVLNEIFKNYKQDKDGSIDYWIEKFLHCNRWYGVNYLLTDTATIFEKYYERKHYESFLSTDIVVNDAINLQYSSND